MQQGNSLGPLFFCLYIHQVCSRLKSELCLFYLDGCSLGGYKEDVLQDLNMVECDGAELGLHLNHQKSEVICVDNDTSDAVLSFLQGAHVVDPLKAIHLGSPISDMSSISTTLREKIKLLEMFGEKTLTPVYTRCPAPSPPLTSHSKVVAQPHSLALLPFTDAAGI